MSQSIKIGKAGLSHLPPTLNVKSEGTPQNSRNSPGHLSPFSREPLYAFLSSGGIFPSIMSCRRFCHHLSTGIPFAILSSLLFSLSLVNSRVGRALRSMNTLEGGNEDAAKTLGVDVASYKAKVFALSAVYASIAGSIWAHYLTTITPADFTFWLSVLLLIMRWRNDQNSCLLGNG